SIRSFHHPPDTRNLHSFPTRRSSDLAGGKFKSICPGMGIERKHTLRDPAAIQDAKRASRGQPLIAAMTGMLERLAADLVARQKRSEEHTSELQSRGHLVCRLLLEKKK